MRLREALIEIYKVIRGLHMIRRLRREAFKTRVRYKFAKSVTQRHNNFTNRVVPRWNKLPETIVFAPSLVALKSALGWHHKRFGCYGY